MPSTTAHFRRHQAELLEQRILLASFAFVDAHGVLQLRGTNGADSIVISPKGTSISVKLNSTTAHIDASKVKAIFADGRDGNDRIEKRFGVRATLAGGAGDDTLIGGPAADYFRGGAGQNEIHVDGSDDVIDYSDRNLLTLGSDQTASPLALNDDIGRSLIYSPKKPFRILGTAGDDVIAMNSVVGAVAGVTVDGGAGDDEISIVNYDSDGDSLSEEPIVAVGGSGNDTICIDSDAPASTSVFGGSGDDELLFGQTEVAVDPKLVHGGPGRDTLDLSAFDIDSVPLTVYTILPDVEAFVGPPDNIDDLTELAVPYAVIGNDLGNDIRISSRLTTVTAGAGNDRIEADINQVDISESDPGHDLFNGDGGNDTIIGFGGDTIYGDRGNDSITGGGHSHIYGGDGNDSINGGRTSTLSGGPGNDRITAGKGSNVIHGNAGNDTIFGGLGNDTIEAGAGDDVIFANDGSKTSWTAAAGSTRRSAIRGWIP
jgi:Ca2+-binding RTX toxin-like protein